ncbi:MAG: hypothetical protein ACUVS4_03360 [Chloroflexaceae bacterium]
MTTTASAAPSIMSVAALTQPVTQPVSRSVAFVRLVVEQRSYRQSRLAAARPPRAIR